MLPIAHAADYVEPMLLGAALLVFLAWLVRERVRTRRAATEEGVAGEPTEPGHDGTR